jgi:hypothetical protein
MLSIHQIRWSAFLVSRKAGVPIDVSRVCEALEWAHNQMPRLTIDSIKHIASAVNPDVKGFRTIELNGNSAVDEIEGHLLQLLDAWEGGKTDAKHFYWEFCAIHPFGSNVNDAVAQVLYNWCNRTAGRPTFPPAYGL